MQIEEILSEELKKQFRVTYKTTELEEEYKSQLENLKKKAKIQGFRPGMASLDRVEKEYGQSVRENVVDSFTNKAFKEAKSKVSGSLLQDPYTLNDEYADAVKKANAGEDFSFVITCELMPEIANIDVSAFELYRLKTGDVPQKKIDERVNQIAKNYKHFESVPNKIVESGDKVIITGRIHPKKGKPEKLKDLEVFADRDYNDSVSQAIAKAVMGMKASETKVLTALDILEKKKKLSLKEDFDLHITIRDVKISKNLPVGDELAKSVGNQSLDELKKDITEEIQKRYDNLSHMHLKRHLLDKLYESCSFPVPQKMVDNEFDVIWQQVQREISASNEKGEALSPELSKPEEELKKEYRDIARRRVSLGLFVAKIARENKIRVNDKEFQAGLIRQLMQYPYSMAQQLEQYFTKTEHGRNQIMFPILEDKVVNHLLTHTKITEKELSYEDFRKEIDKVIPVEMAFDEEDENIEESAMEE